MTWLKVAYYDKLNALLKSIRSGDWKIYLKAATLANYANVLSKFLSFDASFEISRKHCPDSRAEIPTTDHDRKC